MMTMNERELADRLVQARAMKEDIDLNSRVLKLAEGTPFYEEIKQVNEEMKDRLSNFDVYQQKPIYACWRCSETVCVCDISLE